MLFSVNPQKTMDALETILGFTKIAEDAEYARYQAVGEIGNIVDVPLAKMGLGFGGAGTVHHIAWRAKISNNMKNGEAQSSIMVINRLQS